MNFSNKSKLKLSFEIGKLNGQSMGMEFINVGTGNTHKFEEFHDELFYYEDTIIFPSSIIIKLFNKGPRDTIIIDAEKNIYKDKYIKFLNIEVDDMPCAPYYISKHTILNTVDGQSISSAYWGFNGTVTLDFPEDNSFYWSVHTYNKGLR
jgi:hypothetical protein